MAMSLLQAHTAVADPHGDRSYADDKFATQLDLTTLSGAVNQLTTRVTDIETGATAFSGVDTNGVVVHTIDPDNDQLGFHGVTPVSRQTVTGSVTLGTALSSLLTALESLGLIVDESTT